MLIVRLISAAMLAFLVGKMVQKIHLPAILGWLITGMLVGPHALGLITPGLLDSKGYTLLMNILEVGVGCLIGSELLMVQLKKSGKKIVVTTLFQSLTTFVVVTFVFSLLFYIVNIPLYVAFLFGGIALATAPAPALSIVQEYKTKGPVTDTLIPIAILDDVVAIIVFFTITSIISALNAEQAVSLPLSLLRMIGLPIVLGGVLGYLASFVLKIERSAKKSRLLMLVMCSAIGLLGYGINQYIFKASIINFMLVGMAFSAMFANHIDEKRLEETMEAFDPLMGIFLLLVILNLGAPLDYHLILGAGMFTLVYILSRAFGKYFGARFGAKLVKLPNTVVKYLGLTLLPHSGVSLVFTGIAVSSLNSFDPQSAIIIQGTIAAAAIINEVIAVILAKRAFEWAGEIGN